MITLILTETQFLIMILSGLTALVGAVTGLIRTIRETKQNGRDIRSLHDCVDANHDEMMRAMASQNAALIVQTATLTEEIKS